MIDIKQINNTKELHLLLNQIDEKKAISTKEIFLKFIPDPIKIEYLLSKIYSKNHLILDVRSENEFKISNIPNSLNFPILNNQERHYVGLTFKKFSKEKAFLIATEFANSKIQKLKNFVDSKRKKSNEIFVYCWRGGGRSQYTCKLLKDLNFKAFYLLGGYKSYRNNVVNTLSLNNNINNIIELRGKTGVGKSELLNLLKLKIPVIDIERCANHTSSLFGLIPYSIKGYNIIKKQSSFENNIFASINKYSDNNYINKKFLIESESRKVGNFYIHNEFYNKLNNASYILIDCSIQNRIERIKKDYFIPKISGSKLIIDIFIKKERFFKKELSNKIYEIAKDLLFKDHIDDFIKILLKYYDTKYKTKQTKPIAVINSDNTVEAAKEIEKIFLQTNI